MLEQVETTSISVAFVLSLPDLDAATLYAWWVEPDKLTRWWPQELLLVESIVGGRYHFYWRQVDAHLRGEYLEVIPGQRLVFTWSFDHETDLAPRTVALDFANTPGGAEMHLTHGTYTDSVADQQDRQNHIDGWQFFLGRLSELVAAD